MGAVRPKAKRLPNWRNAWNTHFDYEDENGETVHGKGKKYLVDGIIVELFPFRVMLGMLRVTRHVFYRWEQTFKFPARMWRLKESRIKSERWYSRKQLIAVRTIYEQLGRLQNEKDIPRFVTAVRSVFYTVDIPMEYRNEKEAG